MKTFEKMDAKTSKLYNVLRLPESYELSIYVYFFNIRWNDEYLFERVL